MATLLVSFCNVFPPGLALGLYDFDSDNLNWIDISSVSENCLGVDGICRWEDDYWLLTQLAWGGISGLAMMDHDLNICRHYKLAKTGDAHSLIAHKDGFLITDTQKNRLNLIKVDGDGMLSESEYWRYCDEQADVVHLNSVAQLDGDIYVSIFGPKPLEGWASAQGGQIINITQNKVICENLAHPHSLVSIEGALYWLESKKGVIHRFSEKEGHQVVLQLGGYLRGFAYDDRYLYVAASALRRRSRSTGVISIPPSDNPDDLHSWIYRIDRENLQVEKRRLTAFGAEIYDLALVREEKPESNLQRRTDAIIQRIWRYEDEYLGLKGMHEAADHSVRTLVQELVDNKMWDKAAFHLENLLKGYPHDGYFEYLLAFCLHMQHKDPDRALHYYNLALEHGFEEFWVRYNRGSLHMELGNLEQARADLERAVELKPEHSDARKRLEELMQRISAPQLPEPQPEPADLQAQLAEKDELICSLQKEISQLTDRVEALEAQMACKEAIIVSLNQQLNSVYNSRRWRLATQLAEGYWKIRRLLNFIGLKRER